MIYIGSRGIVQKNMNLSQLTNLSEEPGIVEGCQMEGENEELMREKIIWERFLDDRVRLNSRSQNDYSDM